MATVTGYQKNLETIIEAAKNGDLAVMDVLDTRLDKPQAALVALYQDAEGMINFVPLAVMCEANPYEYLRPCDPDHESGYAPLGEV